MDDVQSWWEVPAFAHFCHVFRKTFDLLYFEIAELEAALLNVQDPEMSISLEQLIVDLLKGFYDSNDVTLDNFKERLQELFDDGCDDDDNPLGDSEFSDLSPRLKIEVLLKLCQFRLDVQGVIDEIQHIPSEDMQAKCIGKDSESHVYWYFCEERLYKEDPSVKPKKFSAADKKKTKTFKTKNGRRVKHKENEDSKRAWSIVCYNSSDWDKLLKSFSKSKKKDEMDLAKKIRLKYIPMLPEVVAEREQQLRKRYIELAPKRTSSRICKVQALRKLEEDRMAEEAETKRKRLEQEEEHKAAVKKQDELEARSKRIKERERVIQDRLKRAQQREFIKEACDSHSDPLTIARTSRSIRTIAADTSVPSEPSSSSDSEDEENEDEDLENEDYEEESDSERLGMFELKPEILHNTYDLTKWNSTIAKRGQSVHVLSIPYNYPASKRLKLDETNSYSKSITDYKRNPHFQAQQHAVSSNNKAKKEISLSCRKPYMLRHTAKSR